MPVPTPESADRGEAKTDDDKYRDDPNGVGRKFSQNSWVPIAQNRTGPGWPDETPDH